MDIEYLKRQKIPDLSQTRVLKKDYRHFPIDSNNDLYHEAWADIRDFNLLGINHYSHANNPPYYQKIPGSTDSLFLRKSVIEKLINIDKDLKAMGLRLFFLDCYRPIEVQNYMHDSWVPNRLKQDHPDWSNQKITSEVDNYWAKGAPSTEEINANSPPPHSTGGAFDVTICKNNGEQMFMGSIFDDVAPVSNTDYFENQALNHNLTFSETEASMNRRLLYWLMINAGFVNNPTEWWHYSYGDQMWAKLLNKPTALYSKMAIKNLN